MSLQRITNENEVPPGRFPFTSPETGWNTVELSLPELFDKIKRHYDRNGLPLPENWKEIVENRICEQLPPGWCSYSDGSPGDGKSCGVSGDSIIHAAHSLGKLVWEVFKGENIFVSQAEADERAEICSKCHRKSDSSACGGCGAMKGIIDGIARIRGQRKTKYDHLLKYCCICGCNNSCTVHIRKDILQAGESTDISSKRPDWCWWKDKDPKDAKLLLKL